MAKVSIIGAGMLGQPGVAAQMFDILSQEGINIEIISTSEISISCLVAEDRVKDAVRVIPQWLIVRSKRLIYLWIVYVVLWMKCSMTKVVRKVSLAIY